MKGFSPLCKAMIVKNSIAKTSEGWFVLSLKRWFGCMQVYC